MTAEQLDALKAAAESARPGPWFPDGTCVITRHLATRKHVDGGYYGIICETTVDDDCRSIKFIAAASPDVVLALIEEVKRGRELRPCPKCKKMVPGIQLVPSPDPYDSEINDDDTPVSQCDECHDQSSGDI